VHVEGDNVGLFVTISNDGDTPDQLTAVRTVNAQQVVMREGTGPTSPVSIPVPAHSVVSLQYPGGPHLELVDLKFDTRGGSFIPMTFGFQNAGAVNVNVFVEGFSQPTVAPAS
jgi:copper(I)-binding protein